MVRAPYTGAGSCTLRCSSRRAPSKGLSSSGGPTAGGLSVSTPGPAVTAPVWLRLVAVRQPGDRVLPNVFDRRMDRARYRNVFAAGRGRGGRARGLEPRPRDARDGDVRQRGRHRRPPARVVARGHRQCRHLGERRGDAVSGRGPGHGVRCGHLGRRGRVPLGIPLRRRETSRSRRSSTASRTSARGRRLD